MSLADRVLVGADAGKWHEADRVLFVAQFADLQIIKEYLAVRCALQPPPHPSPHNSTEHLE